MTRIQTLGFSVNTWNHLYSLQQAIKHNDQLTGRTLSISGRIRNQPFLQNHDTKITINFFQVEKVPDYPKLDSSTRLLGEITLVDKQLCAEIEVDGRVFEELRKNLMEYADIEGIHIMVTLGLLSDAEYWQDAESVKIIQLDYAMKGDA